MFIQTDVILYFVSHNLRNLLSFFYVSVSVFHSGKDLCNEDTIIRKHSH